jgi:hypothetical protein
MPARMALPMVKSRKTTMLRTLTPIKTRQRLGKAWFMAPELGAGV